MSVRIQLPGALREYAGGAVEFHTTAATADAALHELVTRHPLLRRHLFDDAGVLRGFVCIYLNSDDIRDLPAGAAAELRDGDVLLVVPSIAGGHGADGGAAGAGPAGEGAAGAGAAGEGAAPAAPVFSRAEVERYARHITLPEVGWEGQRRLRAARVAVVGAGGLGSPVGLYLAAAGVGTIGLIDFDTVDISNLQRQVMYGTADVGRPKVDAAMERLRDLNPHVQVVGHRDRLTSANALDVLDGYDIVVDGTDNFPTRYLVNDACVLLGRPYVYGSILRFEGQVSVFDARSGPCYRCLFREPPPPGLVPSCAEGGVLGVLPGIIGSLQALETIKLIIGSRETLVGRLALFDALSFRWRELKLRKNQDCAVCGANPTVTSLIDYDDFCGMGEAAMSTPQQNAAVPQMSVTELKQKLDNGEDVVLIDVREPFEWDIANLAQYGARMIPLDEVLDRSDEIERDTQVVVYCRSGARSAGAVRQLRTRGFDNLWNLHGGLRAWAQEIDPDMALY